MTSSSIRSLGGNPVLQGGEEAPPRTFWTVHFMVSTAASPENTNQCRLFSSGVLPDSWQGLPTLASTQRLESVGVRNLTL